MKKYVNPQMGCYNIDAGDIITESLSLYDYDDYDDVENAPEFWFFQ